MNFKGRAEKIKDIDLPRVGHIIGVGEDPVHAVLDVESAGYGFDKQDRPRMLFEPHIFYRQLRSNHAKQKEAMRKGLAYPKWRRNYPKDSYPRLQKAIAIDRDAALRSASWGLGQVMGFNHAAAGHSTVLAFVKAMMRSEGDQLEAMIQFILTNGLDDEMRDMEKADNWAQLVSACRRFARGYNGPGYEKNNYHTRIAQRYQFWKGKKDTPWSPFDAAAEEEVEKIEPAGEKTGPLPQPKPAPRENWITRFFKWLAS